MKHLVPSHGLYRFTTSICFSDFSCVFFFIFTWKLCIHIVSLTMLFLPCIQTFARFMRGNCPQTILTDLDPGLRDAIPTELPATKHVISVWNILSKVSSWFFHPLGSRFTEFKSEFEALCRLESKEQFELQWNQMISMFELNADKHITLLYSFRTSWAPSYARGYLLARMATVVYSKSVDRFLKDIFKAQTCLRTFFEQVLINIIFHNLNLKIFLTNLP